MHLNHAKARLSRLVVFMAMSAGFAGFCPPATAGEPQTVPVRAFGFELAQNDSVLDGTNRLEFSLDAANPVPPSFNQSAVKQSSVPALQGPDPKIPYFTVRFAMPIPPENATNNFAALTGIEPEVFTHNHSPGFEILPNGDALAIYFSTPPGKAEADISTSFVQARLRYGSEEWDWPELFFKTEGYNDQSGLLWNDGGKIRFFGGGRNISDMVPFREVISTDNGATWTFSIPQLAAPAQAYEAQPITSAFRSGNSIYFAMDGSGAHSFLWRSEDDGIHWTQMPGRTGGRHSAIVPLDDKGDLLSIGGKNAAVNGWSPENFSTNYGVSWSKSVESPFPPLGSAQRPSLIKLADGNLFFVSDAYLHKLQRPPPPNWDFGNGAFVAISTNNGISWRIKTLPVQLPNHERGTNGTLGYVTARQAPNGVIHVLTTETQPCLHYELNEAWIFSDAGDCEPENSGGEVKKYSEKYPDGKIRSKWSARICPNGRYLLDGKETDFYESGAKQHEVTYANGRKTGAEIFWSPDGKKLWSWSHDLKNNSSVWTQYWPNGKVKNLSTWNTQPTARDLNRNFFGLVANGPAKQWNEDGKLKFSGNFSNGLLLGGMTP
jgi:antitoxin component YwqK of YwqJK toxin-antitoxin module